jgi:hypothetical protein
MNWVRGIGLVGLASRTARADEDPAVVASEIAQ